MFSCLKIRKKILPYLDNCLEEEGKKRVESHLDRCEYCRDKVEGLRRTHEFLKGRERARRSPDFWVRFATTLRQRLDERRESPRLLERPYLRYPRLVPAGALPLLLVIVFLLGMLGNRVFRVITLERKLQLHQVQWQKLDERLRQVTGQLEQRRDVELAGLFYRDSAEPGAGIIFTTLELARAYPEFRDLIRTEKSRHSLARGIIIFAPAEIIGLEQNSPEKFFQDFSRGEGMDL